MIQYWLEFEESIGRVWDKFLTKKVLKHHESQRVYLSEIAKKAILFYHLFGGEKGKDIKITDQRKIKRDRSNLEKLSFMGESFFLAWQDDKSVYLPTSLALFDNKKDNEMHYYWLLAMAVYTPEKISNLNAENTKSAQLITARYQGFDLFLKKQALLLTDQQPNPFWIYPAYLTTSIFVEEDEKLPPPPNSKEDCEQLEMRKEAEQDVEKSETDGFVSFLPESLMSIFEKVNVDRMEDDSFDKNALYHAEDLDKITLGKQQANLNARVKLDLDINADLTEIYPLGKGHFIDEWDYKKQQYLINYVCIKPQISINVVPIKLPYNLKKSVNKIRHELDSLALDQIRRKNLTEGDDIDLDAWITYRASHSQNADQQGFYTRLEKQTRDMATLILADVSLSTESGITQETRVIDVTKDSLMVFSEALEKLKDQFAIYSFSSLKNTKVYFHIIKNFKEPYSDLIRGRIDSMRPQYYTRLGAAVREASDILEKQKANNKLLLIVSDGKPNDVDRYDGRYGIEDTKKAIDEVRKKGITPFCITVDTDAKSYLAYLFGQNGYRIVSNGLNLPRAMSEIYINLTK